MLTIMGSALISTLLFAVIALSGLGIGRVLGLGSHPLRLLLAPSVLVAVLALMLVSCVMMGIPLRHAAPYVWAVVGASALYGAWHWGTSWAESGQRRVVLAAVVASALVLGGFLQHGLFTYLGSPNQDGFTYVAFGEYLRQFPRGTEGGLAPLYQYGSHLSATRYVAAASLAVFIPPGSQMDTQMMVGPLLFVATFAFAMGVGYLGCVVRTKGANLSPSLLVALTVLGGWFPFVLLANNFDNLIVLSFAPTLFGLGLDDRLAGRSKWLVPGLLCAAAIYIYPELSVLVIAGYYLAGVDRLVTSARKRQILLWLLVASVTLVLIAPYLPEAIRFFQNQFALTKTVTGPRPGNGFMPDLLVASRLPAALWGFQHGTSWVLNYAGLFAGAVLALLTLLGAWLAMRARMYSVCLFVVGSLVLLAMMIGVKRYDYGAYKILLFSWWGVALLVSLGVARLSRRPEAGGAIHPVGVAALVVLGMALLIWGNQQRVWANGFAHKQAGPLREARDRVAALGGVANVLVSDPVLNAWMVYQLRDLPIAYPQYNGYLAQAHVLPVMARSNAPVDGGKYVLVGARDSAQGREVWQNQEFRLVVQAEGEGVVTFGRMEAPNGVERVDGDTFVWLDRNPASLELHSSQTGTATLLLEIIGGTSVADSTTPLSVSVESAGTQISNLDLYRGPSFTVRVPVESGVTRLVMRANYDGALGANPNGDMRVLLAGVKIRGLKFDK